MSNRRKSPSEDYPKKSRSISFAGKDGYDVLDFFDEIGGSYEYGKSGLVIDLLKVYKEAIKVYGKEDAMLNIRMNIEEDNRKRKE